MAVINSALDWLLEANNPGVRYLALRDLVGLTPNDPQLLQAKVAAYKKGPIEVILRQMDGKGFWKKSGAGYNPKYFSAVWSLILLSQLGASVKDDKRIKTACDYYLEHALSKDNSFSYNGTPSGTVPCLEGNMCAALTLLDYKDPRLDLTYDWMARSVLGNDVKYYAYTCGPNFACGANGKKPCAWGAVKVMLAFSKLAKNKRTPVINNAIKKGKDFLFSIDPVTSDYPTRTDSKPNRSWWTFGFPVFYVTDILQIVEALGPLGYGKDLHLKKTINYIKNQQGDNGYYALDYDYPDKTWYNFGKKHEANKWVTYRVLKALKNASK
jgi:hypothetical protein